VKSLVLRAADEAESLWKNKFSFEKISDEEVCSVCYCVFISRALWETRIYYQCLYLCLLFQLDRFYYVALDLQDYFFIVILKNHHRNHL
jgi:hypothetical protein